MIERCAVRILLLVLGCKLALPFCSAEPVAPAAVPAKPALAEAAANSTKVFHPLSPGPSDGQIAIVTAKMLENFHYLRQPLDRALSVRFFDRYLELYDPQHVHFLQSDLAEFDHYRTNLDRLTLPEHGAADTRVAYEIFNRFMQRLEQHVAYVDELLKNEKFTFDTNERVLVNRKDQPFPKNLDEAKAIWRERLRVEYLQEKVAKAAAKKKAEAARPGAAVEPKPKAPPKTPAEEIVDALTHSYHRSLRAFKQWGSEDVLQVYLTALARVYDPHSDYMGSANVDNFAISMNLSLFGIGAELTSEDGYCVIHRLIPGGPAAECKKIKERDRIVAVAQSNQPPVDVVDMSLSKAVQLIRGPKSTEVRLTIMPEGGAASDCRVVTLIRREIKLEDQEAKAKLIEMPEGHGDNLRLGFIDLPSFYASFDPANNRGKTTPKSTTADVSTLLTKLKQEHVNGVILDLRHNGGGLLEEAIKLTGLFIRNGPVVQVKGFDGKVQEEDDTNESVLYDGPLIVLTSRLSASASEILAGALQDYGRAIIVGDSSTHGKGTVQSVQPLRAVMRAGTYQGTNDPGDLKWTIKKFYRPSGASTQLKGVVPDVILPSILSESKDIGESSLENPLPWDTIPSAKFQRLNRVEPYLAELRRRSAQRLATDKEYQYIREDIALFRKQQADKTVTLSEKQRLQERAEADARVRARDKERLARPEPAEKIYELSLKQALMPGLPAPLARTNSTLAKLETNPNPALRGAGTNASLEVHDGAGSVGLEDDADEEKAPAVDAALNESEHVLVDYLSLLPNNRNISVAGTQAAQSPALPASAQSANH